MKLKNNSKAIYSLIIAIVAIVIGITTCLSFHNHYDFYDAEAGGWISMPDKMSWQTWQDYWQASLDNPYADESMKAEAKWVIENGYADSDLATGGMAYANAGYPYDKKNSAPVATPNKPSEEKKDSSSQEKIEENLNEDNSLNIIPEKEEWIETERVEATCTEDGEVTYTEQKSGKTKTETIAALGHTKGKAEITAQPTLFNKGEQVIKCTRCNEVLESEVLPAKVPMTVWAILFTSVIVVLVATSFFIKSKRR